MTAIHETAYPRIRSNLSDKELEALYTPTSDDLAFIHRSTKSPVAAFGCLSRKPEDVNILDFFLSRFHPVPVYFHNLNSRSR